VSLPFDDETAPLFGVGQVADMLGVKSAFLRRLDSHDVISPARSDGDQRRYSQGDVRRVQEVMSLVSEGFTLVAIRRIFELKEEVRLLREEVASLRRAEGVSSPRLQKITRADQPHERRLVR
jgi:MerR family transcriptional regulator/heat shock protein HspR